VTVQYRASSEDAKSTTERTLTLIGTTEKYSLFYSTENDHPFVVPTSQIVSIEFVDPVQQ